MSPLASSRAPVWARALRAAGFADRGRAWARGPVRATFDRGWLVLRAPAGGRGLDPLSADAEWPGLWRLVPRARGPARLFELPPALIAAAGSDAALAPATLTWALATVDPRAVVPAPPPSAGAPSAHPHWSVRAAGLVTRVRALHGDSRAGLELPLGTRRADPGLAAERVELARATLLATRSCWRLVRSVWREGPCLRIDLRGAPPAASEVLERAALDALQVAASRLLEPLDLLLDPALGLPAGLLAATPDPVPIGSGPGPAAGRTRRTPRDRHSLRSP